MEGGKLQRFVSLALVAGLILASCGGDDATEPSTTTSGQQITAPDDNVDATASSSTATSTTSPASIDIEIEGKIGVVGCSNTTGAVAGYTQHSELDLLTEGGLIGGSLAVWGNPRPARHDRYWGLYDERRPAAGYAGTWIQMCIRTTEHEGSFDSAEQGWVEHIVDQIRQRDGDIPIWISGVNSYGEGVLCPSIGPDGAAIAAEAADWAAANITGVERGPDLGPLEEEDRDPGDDCHPNASGQDKLGLQLVAFFDGA